MIGDAYMPNIKEGFGAIFQKAGEEEGDVGVVCGDLAVVDEGVGESERGGAG